MKGRSAADIAKALGQVVALVKRSKAGMRAEEIRKALKLAGREVPRVLKEGLAKKKLKSKGQKRATTYSAAQVPEGSREVRRHPAHGQQ